MADRLKIAGVTIAPFKILLALLAGGSLGCGSDHEVLSLTQVCSQITGATNPCYTRFDATLTSGVSGDHLAVRLGPNGGEFHIQLVQIQAINGAQWSLDVLAAANAGSATLVRSLTWGSCGAQCPADPVDVDVDLVEDFAWASVVSKEAGSNAGGTFIQIPPDAELVLSGSNIDILALRTPGFDNTNYYY